MKIVFPPSKDRSHKEKYMKYKTKYLELKKFNY